MIIDMNEFSVFWGDASLALDVKGLDAYRQGRLLIDWPWDELRKNAPFINNFFFLHQVHGSQGHLITEHFIAKNYPWTMAGDYLLTNVPGIAIGVLTADCLPIAVCDPVNHAVAMIHAGWRSSVAGIVDATISRMYSVFGSKSNDLRLFLGPCAGPCCYAIGGEIINALGTDLPRVTQKRDGNIYFDLAGYNKLQAEKTGVRAESIDTKYQLCTICNAHFCSYRREREHAGRQISLICLKKR